MSAQPRSRLRIRAILLILMVVPPAAVLLGIPWLREQTDGTVFLVAGIAAAVNVFAAIALAIVQDRTLDEWHRSAAQFSSQWGWTTGASVIALLLALPPMRDGMVSTIANFAQVTDPNHRLVILAFVAGFIATVLTQALCTTIISIVWVSWKSRAPHEPT